MIFRKRLLFAGLALLAGACQSQENGYTESVQTVEAAAPLDEKQWAQQHGLVKNFLQWHQQHLPELDSLLLATVSKQGQGDTAHYQVDTLRAGQYLAYLRRAGWFSRQFLADQRQQFQRRNEEFRRTGQAYGVPVGFSFGWLLYTPQPAKVLAAALRSRQWSVRPADAGGATVEVRLPTSGQLSFEVVTEDGAPRIESIMPNGIEVAE